MRYRVTASLLATLSLLSVHLAVAQQPTKIPLIGFLSASSPSAISARTQAFREGLREVGYVEGKNIVIEYRYAEGKLDRLPALAAELVRLKVSSSQLVPKQPVPPRKQPLRFPLSWGLIMIPLAERGWYKRNALKEMTAAEQLAAIVIDGKPKTPEDKIPTVLRTLNALPGGDTQFD